MSKASNIPQGLEYLSQTYLALKVVAVERGYLDQRDIERLLGREHELVGHPDAVVNAALDALGLDARLD